MADMHRPQRPLKETVADIDKDILRLLVRRFNLTQRMEGRKGHLSAEDEKFLRRSWETAAAAVTKDSRCFGTFFALLQEMTFLPPPRESKHLPSYNLAPARRPVELALDAPLTCRGTRAWLYLAAASGAPATLAPCLMNDHIVDCVKALNHAGAQLSWDDRSVTAKPGSPMGTPDMVLHMGSSPWTFFLFLAHYLGRHAKAKFTGEGDLKFANLSGVRHFVQLLGARMVCLVPKSDALPLRIECSGMLPDGVALPADVPAEMGEALLLAAPGFSAPLLIDFGQHPLRELSLARTLPLLRDAKAQLDVDGFRIRVTPGPLAVPQQPSLPMEPEVAIFLLGLPLLLSGKARLKGTWPSWPSARTPLSLLENLGLNIVTKSGSITATAEKPLARAVITALPPDYPSDWYPLVATLAACAAIRKGEASLPASEDPEMAAHAETFLARLNLVRSEDGALRRTEDAEPTPWNAPSPVWSLALALAACARPNCKLGNPGSLMELFPGFWNIYNALPTGIGKAPPPQEAAPEPQAEDPPPVRRRIRTETKADVPAREVAREAPAATDPAPPLRRP